MLAAFSLDTVIKRSVQNSGLSTGHCINISLELMGVIKVFYRFLISGKLIYSSLEIHKCHGAFTRSIRLSYRSESLCLILQEMLCHYIHRNLLNIIKLYAKLLYANEAQSVCADRLIKVWEVLMNTYLLGKLKQEMT
jgi:hypothetical protein